jgi:hypothetical protein
MEFVARDEGEKDTDTDPTWLPDERKFGKTYAVTTHPLPK